MDIAAWLRSLGLEQYEQAFRENEIDERVLQGLTADDLKDLGVLMVGHRRRLLDAIAALGAPLDATARPGASARDAGGGVARAEAERRQLTVLFCDVVGSTELAARLDPEDLREIIRAYHRHVTDALAHFGGFVAKFMGDGVLAYFGYPQAHEDDAERAVRAGLAIVDAIARAALAQPLQVRIGIATGLVVVGDSIGAGAAQEQAVVGETPNLAARLQTLAEPNAIVVADSTRQLIGALFETCDLGPQTLKGFAVAPRVWRVMRESGVESRFAALRSGETPLVGREEEIELLLRRWKQAKTASGRVVLLSAEPGIGKSRLTEALHQRISAESYTRVRYFCSPHHQDSALLPIIAQLERASGFDREDTPAVKRHKLAQLLVATLPAEDDLSLFAELLSIPGEPSANAELTPQRKKEKTFEALLRHLDTLARQQPVLMVFEDLHWCDPTSREFLDLMVARIERLPVLLITTFRPEFQPPWIGHPHVTTVTLNRLSRDDGAALIHRLVTDEANISAELIDEILDRTEGVPLFLEEVTKSILEAAGGDAAVTHRIASAIPGARLAVPATLQASLMARLDRLGPTAKEVAQIGAAIGREFSYGLLIAVGQRDEPEMRSALDRLVAAGLVFQHGVLPTAEFRFKHSMVQDTAYGTLLRGPRRALHLRIALGLEEKFAEIVQSQPEKVAYHLTEAGLQEKAASYWLKAGRNCAARSANIEAIAHLRRGIDAIGGFAEGSTKDRLELDFQIPLGSCLMATQGPVSGASLATFARARELCERLGDPPEYLQVMFWLANVRFVRGEMAECLEACEAGLALAQARGDSPALLNWLRGRAMILMFIGRVREARDEVERALAAFSASDETERGVARAAGQDAGAAGLAVSSWTLWLLGYADAALERAVAALDRADAIKHPHTQAYVCYYAAVVQVLRGNAALARGQAERCLALSQQHGFRQWLGPSRIVRDICASLVDGAHEAIENAQRELAEYRRTGSQVGVTLLCAIVGEALASQQSLRALRDVVADGIAAMDRTGERFFESELYRLKARAVLGSGGPDAEGEAEAALQLALTTARGQCARALELRAGCDLARLWQGQGKRMEAFELLATIYGWFTEGFDAPDMRQAKALLDIPVGG